MRLWETGQHKEALKPALDAANLYESLGTDNLRFVTGYAIALSNLGTRYAYVGHPREAVRPGELSVEYSAGLTTHFAASSAPNWHRRLTA